MTTFTDELDRRNGADVPTAPAHARQLSQPEHRTGRAAHSAAVISNARRGPNPLLRRARAWRADLILTFIAVETGIAIGLGVEAQPWSDWTSPHLLITALSRVAAMAGTALALASILLSARVPWIERSVGQDRLIKWHRLIGPYSLYLILAHVVFVTVGYSMADKINLWSEWWNVVLTMEWMLPALAGFICMMMIGVTSYRRVRGKLKYETWWAIHLYAYLGVALSFMHQIVDGSMFIGQPAMKTWWTAIYIGTFGLVLWFRVLVPIVSSLYHGFRVESVVIENHNTISVIMKGRHLDELGAQGGQFFGFRFMTRRYWWESHPYSISASPRNDRLRITVKDLGDHSAWMRQLTPGTRVWIEGPYGVFTAEQTNADRITLIAGGVGVTPVRALLEELPQGSEIDIVWRASTEDDLMLRDEVEALAAWHNARIHYVVGSRKHAALDVRTLRELVPNVRNSDVFMCGPEFVIDQAMRSLLAMGVPEERIHHEAFAY